MSFQDAASLASSNATDVNRDRGLCEIGDLLWDLFFFTAAIIVAIIHISSVWN
jgi:hypothetical protein